MSERNSGFERDTFDWYVEPEWTVDLLRQQVPFEGSIWDPACGSCTIPKVFKAWKHETFASDIVLRGTGQHDVIDFLSPAAVEIKGRCNNIVSNPQYKLAEEFAYRALELARQRVAMLVNIKFLASQRRHTLFTTTPVESVFILSTRPSMPPGDKVHTRGNGSMDFAWIVWDKRQSHSQRPSICWLKRQPASATGAAPDLGVTYLSDRTRKGKTRAVKLAADIEITPEMIRAGADELDGATPKDLWDGYVSAETVAEQVFRAMLQAALLSAPDLMRKLG